MWDGLIGSLTVKNGPLSQCKVVDLATSKPGQPSEIWGRRHMMNFASLGMNLVEIHDYAHDIPISFIEVIMVKTDLSGHLARELRLSSASESTRLRQAWWGLHYNPDVSREADSCPYLWEYSKDMQDFWVRGKWIEGGKSNRKLRDFTWNPLSGIRPRDVWWGKGQYTEARCVVCAPTYQAIGFYPFCFLGGLRKITFTRVLTSETGVRGPYHRAVIEVSSLDHSPGWNIFQPQSETSDRRVCASGVSEIVQRLNQEEAPILCGSPARFELARYWLADCVKLHSECNAWSEGFSLPSRVIDVGPEDGSQEPFLYMPKDSQIGLYLCLSHRWGGAKVLQTLMGDLPGTAEGRPETFSEFQTAIPIETMPKTFRDAVHVTRALRFRYIWIDSLCIVQDRPSDWEAEAKKMGEYYHNACLTLVAGSAVSADSGLFFPITRPAVPCHVGSVSLEVPDCRHHGAEPHTFPLFAREPRMARSRQENGAKPAYPLDERAWVMQEEMLSARSLIFTSQGLYWECAKLSASEFHPHGSQYQYTRSLSWRDPEPYGDEIFLPSDETYARLFKYALMKDPEFIAESKSSATVQVKRMMLLVQDELQSATVALGQALVQEAPPDRTEVSIEMQMSRCHRTQSEKRQQIFKVNEKHENLTGSTPQPLSPQPARASLGQELLNEQTWLWHTIVTEYSARQLTRESDRLVAIQGLVSLLRKVRKDRYYAGLWGLTLREDMLWVTEDSEERLVHLCDCCPQKVDLALDLRPRRRLEESETGQGVAPSWSWASADQGVMFMCSGEAFALQYFFRLLGILLDDDAAVLNVQGRLTIEGVLRPIGLMADEVHSTDLYVSNLHSYDEVKNADLPLKSYGSIYDPSDPAKKEIGSWFPDRRTSTSGVVVCVPLLMLPEHFLDGSWDQDHARIHCLVLVPTENCRLRNKASKLLEFRRVGWACFSNEHRAFLGLGNSQRMKDDRSWDVRAKEWARKPVLIDII